MWIEIGRQQPPPGFECWNFKADLENVLNQRVNACSSSEIKAIELYADDTDLHGEDRYCRSIWKIDDQQQKNEMVMLITVAANRWFDQNKSTSSCYDRCHRHVVALVQVGMIASKKIKNTSAKEDMKEQLAGPGWRSLTGSQRLWNYFQFKQGINGAWNPLVKPPNGALQWWQNMVEQKTTVWSNIHRWRKSCARCVYARKLGVDTKWSLISERTMSLLKLMKFVVCWFSFRTAAERDSEIERRGLVVKAY